MRESFRDNYAAYLVLLRSVERERPIAERRPRYCWSATLLSQGGCCDADYAKKKNTAHDGGL